MGPLLQPQATRGLLEDRKGLFPISLLDLGCDTSGRWTKADFLLPFSMAPRGFLDGFPAHILRGAGSPLQLELLRPPKDTSFPRGPVCSHPPPPTPVNTQLCKVHFQREFLATKQCLYHCSSVIIDSTGLYSCRVLFI